MTFSKKHNTSGYKFSFEIPENFEYYDLKQLAKKHKTLDKNYRINAIYINRKGQFGPQAVLATDNELVNAPLHMTETFTDILSDSDSIGMIEAGVAGFKIYTYENKYGKQAGLEFVDLEPRNKKGSGDDKKGFEDDDIPF